MDVRDFGAHGNGIDDDYVAIEFGLDNNDEYVVIPEGRCKIGTTLRIHSNTRLMVYPRAHLF